MNAANDSGLCPLALACEADNEYLAALLLAHPDIDVNRTDRNGLTPFMLAWHDSSICCLRLLLHDSRVKIDELPLGRSFWGEADMFKWCVASGRKIQLMALPEENDAGADFSWGVTPCKSDLMTWFENNPEEARSAVRRELGVVG